MSEYEKLVLDLKTLEQSGVLLPMARDEWDTRPGIVSYGIVSLDFEAGMLHGDGRKTDRAFEGSVDFFSPDRSGAGWVEMIKETLEADCGGAWSLNSHTYERETGLFHWEWTFQTTDTEIPEDGGS